MSARALLWVLALSGLPGCQLLEVFLGPPRPCNEVAIVLKIKTHTDLNRDDEGVPRPVDLAFYALAKTTALDALRAEEAPEDPKAVIGADLLADDSVTVFPDSETERKFSLPSNTRVLGITGIFNKFNRGQWKRTVDVDNLMRSCEEGDAPSSLEVELQDYRIIVPEVTR